MSSIDDIIRERLRKLKVSDSTSSNPVSPSPSSSGNLLPKENKASTTQQVEDLLAQLSAETNLEKEFINFQKDTDSEIRSRLEKLKSREGCNFNLPAKVPLVVPDNSKDDIHDEDFFNSSSCSELLKLDESDAETDESKTDSEDEEKLCVVCDQKPALICLDCDRDLYCKKCFKDYHSNEEKHRTSVAVLCVGCSVGWTSPTLKKLKDPTSKIHITDEEGSWLAASHEFGHFLSPVPAGYLLEKYGRKHCLIGAMILLLMGWIIVVFAVTVFQLYIARCLFGLAMGIVFTVVPLYIAEIASAEIRGALSTFFQSMLYLGHVVEFSIGPFVSFTVLNIFSLSLTFVSAVLIFFLAESPLFLVSVGKREEAISLLKWLSKNENTTESEVLKLENMIAHEDSYSFKFKLLFSKAYIGKLFIVIFTAIAQRFTGMSAFVAYASSTFATTNGLTSDEYTILFGALVFIFTFVSAALIDSLGRRPLVLFSCFGCALTHFICGTYYYENFSDFKILPFIMITLFSIIYSLGLGPLINTLQGELFPPNIKGLASSIVTLSHAASSFAVTKLFQVIKNKEGIYLNFYIFAISCVISFIISYLIVPETKKIELEILQRSAQENYTEEVN